MSNVNSCVDRATVYYLCLRNMQRRGRHQNWLVSLSHLIRKVHYLFLILDSVLVMGGGSFIGYHVSLRLVETARVISLDSFTDRNLIVMQRAKLMNDKGDAL